jgi:hypothetical protein
MSEILKGIAISVGSAVLLSALTWMGLRFSERGQLFWKNLGTFDLTERKPLDPATRTLKVQGVRTLFILAVLALALALGGLIAFVFRSSGVGPTPPFVVSLTPHRIGPTGEQTPEQIAKQGGKDSRFDKPAQSAVVPASSDRLCTISQIQYDGEGGQCALAHRGGHNPWEISVDGEASCQVTCFDFTVTQ